MTTVTTTQAAPRTAATYYAAPVTGGTVTIPVFSGDRMVAFIDPAATLLALMVVLPVASDGQVVEVMCSQIITGLTLSSAGGSILGAVTTWAAVNGTLRYSWSANAGKWFKAF